MAQKGASDLFAVPDFEHSSKWLSKSQNGDGNFFSLDLSVAGYPIWSDDRPSLDKPVASPAKFFDIPGSFEPVHLESFSGLRQKRPELKLAEEHAEEMEDLFAATYHDDENWASLRADLKTWDEFALAGYPQKPLVFATEAGPEMYDAALHSAEDPFRMRNTDSNIVNAKQYAASLLAATLGRSSVFFTWDEVKSSFVPTLNRMRLSGYSRDVLQALQDDCLRCGNICRHLSSFAEKTFKAQPSPGRVALAKAVDSILLVIRSKLGGQARSIVSILQLQALVKPVMTILSHFQPLVCRLQKAKNDEHLLSILFDDTKALEHEDGLMAKLMAQVLCQVSEPWTVFTQQWIGLKPEEGIVITKDGPGRSFIKVNKMTLMDDFGIESEEPDYFLDQDRMPSFVPEDVAQNIFQTGRTLRLLRTHHPNHPLCHRTAGPSSNSPPPLSWHLDWESVQQHQIAVDQYESSVAKLLQCQSPTKAREAFDVPQPEPPTDERDSFRFYGQEKSKLAESLLASIRQLNQPIAIVSERDEVSRLLQNRLLDQAQASDGDEIALRPHWSLLPILSFSPLVDAQARLINREYMKLIFSEHDLRAHVALQKDFHLLGNGVFCSRLSHSLFDPEMETAERTAGLAMSGGVMGLRLRGRESWPPASSELRLALMGILAESYRPLSSNDNGRAPATGDRALPGDLSFAVRDLSDAEIDRCLDVDSLEALDFLRLSYKPPAPLTPVFTPVILVKYDKMFKMLLCLLRLVYVTGEIFRDTHVKACRVQGQDVDAASLRFRLEAQHFVASITAYFFDTGIHGPWRRFEAWLDQLQADVESPEATIGRRLVTLDELRQRHEQTLDQIMHVLLLRKRQQPVLRLLEDILTIILQFSTRTWLRAKRKGTDTAESPGGLYQTFRKKVEVFITVCRGLNERGMSKTITRHDEDENTIDQLLLQLEMSGYYGGTRV